MLQNINLQMPMRTKTLIDEYVEMEEERAQVQKIKKPIPFPTTREKILDAGEKYLDKPEDLALWFYLYLTGVRVSEAVGNKKAQRRGVTWDNLDIKADEKIIVVRSYNQKNRKDFFKDLPIPFSDPIDKKMCKHFMDYAMERRGEKEIFNMDRTYAFKKIKKQVKLKIDAIENPSDPKTRRVVTYDNWEPNPHYLRHCRLTHLVQIYHYDPLHLMAFAGWSNMNMARRYVHFDWGSLAQYFEDYNKKQEQQKQEHSQEIKEEKVDIN